MSPDRHAGDASVADESDSEDVTQAEHDATILRQVHDALRRIENGTYAQCLTDGGALAAWRRLTSTDKQAAASDGSPDYRLRPEWKGRHGNFARRTVTGVGSWRECSPRDP